MKREEKEILIELDGHKFDLDKILTQINFKSLRIKEFNRKYYLQSDCLDSLSSHSLIIQKAEKLLEFINGAMRVFFPKFRNITVTGNIIEKCNDRIKEHTIIRVRSIVARSNVSAKLSLVGEVEKVGESRNLMNIVLAKAIDGDSVIEDVLHLLSLKPDWNNFYKVFEIIRDDIGSDMKKIVNEKELSRFKATAQSRIILGDEARHASKRFKGPQGRKPMKLNEAKKLIYAMVEKWFEYNETGQGRAKISH